MWEQIQNFFQAIWQQLIEALLYLGTPYDFAFAVLDITVLSFIFYSCSSWYGTLELGSC